MRSRLLGLAAKRWSLHEVLEATDFFIKTQEEHGIRQPVSDLTVLCYCTICMHIYPRAARGTSWCVLGSSNAAP